MEYEKRQTNSGPAYTARVELEADPITGKRKRTRITAKTEKELRRLIAATEHRVHTGSYIEPDKQTLREYLTDWLAKKRAGESIRPTTYRSYEQLIRVHILPALGNVRLQKLTAAQLESLSARSCPPAARAIGHTSSISWPCPPSGRLQPGNSPSTSGRIWAGPCLTTRP